MSDRPSHNLGGLDIDLARHIDEVCRRFETNCREGHHPGIEDYPEVPRAVSVNPLTGKRLTSNRL